jgi:hypothetical protein
MNEKDLRDCFAMFAMCGAIMRGENWTPNQIWVIADDMLEAREPEETVGLPAIKKRTKK